MDKVINQINARDNRNGAAQELDPLTKSSGYQTGQGLSSPRQNDLQDIVKRRLLSVENDDRDMWDIATNVPKVSKPIAVAACVCNFIFPGSGTMLAACLTESVTVSKTQLTVALMQAITAFILIGYVFAFGWSVLILLKAFK